MTALLSDTLDLRKERAERTFERLRLCLGSADGLVRDIIRERMWVTLGYATLREAWQDRVFGTGLSEAVLSHIVYTMLDEGAEPEQIAESVGEEVVDTCVRAREYGLEPEHATIVKRHVRRLDRAPRTRVSVRLKADEVVAFEAAAQRAGTTLAKEAARLLRERFA